MPQRPATTSKELDREAQLKLRTYKAAKQRQRIINMLGYSGLTVIAAILFMMVGGERFEPYLNSIGLHGIYNDERGVYADCSVAANRDNPFCAGRRRPREERSWGELRNAGSLRSVPFSLSN